jgi:hypothetical protein
MDVTPNLGLPYVEPADSIIDYPAVDQQRAEILDVAGLVAIDQIELAAAAATLDFSGIPATFHSLLAEINGRGDAAGDEVGVHIRLNNDSGANYDHQYLLGSAAGAIAAEGFALTRAQIGNIPAGAAIANAFGSIETKIPHYRSAAHKLTRSEWMHRKSNATGGLQVGMFLGNWRSVAVVNRITFVLTGGNFAIGTKAVLYGIGGELA